ncbi:MAG: carbohydrate binding family 9 domain-containing protein [Acidobacteriota bacterium]|nr:MAG: carbohydrate binding family 9 domain-containing protein [Acidobacteriota bacterium]
MRFGPDTRLIPRPISMASLEYSPLNRSRGFVVLAIAMILLTGRQLEAFQYQDRPDLPSPDELNVHVIPGGETIKLDGVLDEEVWQRAVPADTFWQSRPLDREPATERTEVRVVQDEEALYFGILCFDSDPKGIITLDMRRDAPLSNDDYVGLYLDTYHDHRNFYYFSTNALGTRRDGIVTDARSYNTAWNGIWQARARITDEGWSAEYRIPFSTLRFGGDQPMTWGFNISRAIRRKQESAYWAPIPRELGRYGTWRGEFFGQLVGIQTSEAYAKWEAEPYILVGGEQRYRPESSEGKFNAGGDLHYDFTPNLRGDLSIRTDFAQVEADQEVINFTRFPLFFPEKREFFLENAGLFNVGYEQEMMMFYSRRIGLSQGQEVPILAAGKLSGRAGPYSLGVLNVQTESTELTSPEGSAFYEPSTNYTVARFKRDLFTNSSFGAILTNNQSSSSSYSRLVGVDGNFWFSPALKGEVLLAHTFNPEGAESDFLGIGRLQFSQQNLEADVRYYAVGPHFVPEMGFVLQNDLRRSSVEGAYTQWVNSRGVRSVIYSGSLVYDTLYDHSFFGRRGTAGVKVNLESNDNFGYTFGPARERIYDSFSVGPISIHPGDYTNRTHDFLFESNASRPYSVIVDYRIMSYWTGDRQQFLFSNNFHPIANLSVDFIYTYNTVDHPQASFNTTTLSNRILYAFTTDLFIKSYIQWNDLEDRFSANFLLGWEYRPGSEIYLVYNEIQDRFDSPQLEPRDRMLLLKWTYNFRF